MELFKRIAKSLFGSSRSSKSKSVKSSGSKTVKIRKTVRKKTAKKKSPPPKTKTSVKTKTKGKTKGKSTRRSNKTKRPVKKKTVKRQPAMVKEALALLPVGEVTHYFPHVQAAVIKVGRGEIRKGEVLSIRGHTTNLRQPADSMQIDHKPVQLARTGDEIGIRVKSRVRAGDKVYKV